MLSKIYERGLLVAFLLIKSKHKELQVPLWTRKQEHISDLIFSYQHVFLSRLGLSTLIKALSFGYADFVDSMCS